MTEKRSRSAWLETVLLALGGFINLAPVVGAVSKAQLSSMYGVAIGGPDLGILLRHRALLFAVVGGLILVSCIRRHLRSTALVVGLFSMLGFVLVALAEGGYSAALGRVIVVDFIGIGLLLLAALIRWKTRTHELSDPQAGEVAQ